MTTASYTSDDEFRIDQPMPMAKRVGLAVVGLICIVLPTWEFRHAFIQLSFLTVFFGIMLAGAYFVGIPFLLSALFGEAQHWSFRDERLHLKRVSLWGVTTETISRADVVDTVLEKKDWDSSPATHPSCSA